MRLLIIFKAAILLFALAAYAPSKPAFHKDNDKTNKNTGFALIELFTSEGCSSCPPADALVAKIKKETTDEPVYILAYHVDYWNHLGWKDAFSKHQYSERQRQYANWLKISSVYTPQIVVNGKKEFIGSEEGTLRNAIKSGLSQPVVAQLTLGEAKSDENRVNINYHVSAQKNQVLYLALVQPSASTKVKGGENGGRTLSHIQIVRELQKVSLNNKADGLAEVPIPEGVNGHGLNVVGFLQNQTTGEIYAANQINLR